MPSVRPSTYSAGTFLEPGNYVIRNPKWVVWDYGNPDIGVQTLAVKIDLIDATGKVHDQYLSAGDPKAFAPSADGRTLVQIGNRKDLAGGSNFAFFTGRLVDNGYAEEDMPEDADVVVLLDGLYGYVDLEDAPERSNMAPRTNADGTPARKSQVPIFQKLLLMPWEDDGVYGHVRPVALDNPQAAQTAGPQSAARSRPQGGPATAQVPAAPAQPPAAPAQPAQAAAPAARGRRGAGSQAAAPAGPSAQEQAIEWLVGQITNEGAPIARDVVMSRAFSDPDLATIVADVAATLANPNIAEMSGGRITFDGAVYRTPELATA